MGSSRNAVSSIAVPIAITSTSGGILGLIIANSTGRSIPFTVLSMSTNYLFLSIPFYSIGFLTLAIRFASLNLLSVRNAKNGVADYTRRDYDDMYSSLIAGSILGSGAGFMQRGKWGILPGILGYGFIAGAGQAIYSKLRHFRQQVALRPEKESGFTFRDVLEGKTGDSFGEIDPFQMLFAWGKRQLERVVTIPSWASPLVLILIFNFQVNAVDLDYRHRLNYKISILEEQIENLANEVKELEAKRI